jgi:hypothetical protein
MARIVITKGNVMIVIGSKGPKIIGPCDPRLQAVLNTIHGIQGTRGLPAPLQQEAAGLATRMAKHAVEAAQRLAGEALDAEGGLVYLDGDDGFSCGSNGKPPIPLPHQAAAAIAVPVVART